MKIVLPGGSGQVGTMLARSFHNQGHEVVVLSREPQVRPWRHVPWDAVSLGAWASEFEGADVVINLAGRSVNCRYTPANRTAIIESRVRSTAVVGKAIERAQRPPKLWLQSSTATIYAHRFDADNDEATGIIGGNEPDAPAKWGFSIEVARSWEATAQSFQLPETRLVLLRSAIVLSPDPGGIFAMLRLMTRLGLGGPIAGGKQYISWVHEYDFISAIEWLIEHPELDGVVNIAAPQSLPQRDFMRILRKAFHQPIGLFATAWMAEIGAALIGSETELLFKSRRVAPARLLASGFKFRYPDWQAAALELAERS
jgi:uncharacterized protein (TIGR01777 family)